MDQSFNLWIYHQSRGTSQISTNSSKVKRGNSSYKTLETMVKFKKNAKINLIALNKPPKNTSDQKRRALHILLTHSISPHVLTSRPRYNIVLVLPSLSNGCDASSSMACLALNLKKSISSAAASISACTTVLPWKT